MKHYRHFLIILLALGIFFAWKQLSAQLVDEQIAEKVRHATVRLITAEPKRQIKFDDGHSFPILYPRGLGSGFFVDHDQIATNIHCVAGKTKIFAKLVGTETFYDIEGVTASDPENDLVILKVASKGPKPLALGNSDAVQIGEPIAAIGSSGGGIEGEIIQGKVYNRRHSDEWFRLKAKLLPGNSGGPILSSKGVIGIAVQTASSSYGFISYAIPSNTLKELLEKADTAKPLDLEKWQQERAILAYDYHSLAQNRFKDAQNRFKEGKLDMKNTHLFFQRAIELLGKAIERYQSHKSHLLRGNVYEKLKEYQKAIDDYTECIKLKPDFAGAYHFRGVAKWKRHLYEKAIADFEEAIALIPADALSYMLMGDSKLKLKRYEEAVVDFGKAIKLIPNNAHAYYNRGTARYEWGKLEEAREKNEAAQNQYQAADQDLDEALRLIWNRTRQSLPPDKDLNEALKSDPIWPRASHNLKLVKEALERLE
ncbi:hypothetical protein C6499_10255 [Candidatus Poribacteria bacterium]|nr:MAG: hypothetical protein C6499_10255 [Candidatus Poribacteria bacterium]